WCLNRWASLDDGRTVDPESEQNRRMRALLKRWWFWGLLVSPFIVVSWLVIFPPLEPSQKKFNQIKEGMTIDQVVEIIGSEDDDRRDPDTNVFKWSMNRALIQVQFREDGTVARKM